MQELAFVDVHVSVELMPLDTVSGLADSVAVTVGADWLVETDAWTADAEVPPLLTPADTPHALTAAVNTMANTLRAIRIMYRSVLTSTSQFPTKIFSPHRFPELPVA